MREGPGYTFCRHPLKYRVIRVSANTKCDCENKFDFLSALCLTSKAIYPQRYTGTEMLLSEPEQRCCICGCAVSFLSVYFDRIMEILPDSQPLQLS